MSILNNITPESAECIKPALYLLPVTMSDGNPSQVLPAYNIDLFRNIKYFVVENVRTARRFLKKVDKSINIDDLTFAELSEHTADADIPPMLAAIEDGHAVGVMSEAGCPAVADPGARLVDIAQQRGITVVPLVGPSSILMALMGSGMNGQNFTFNGYLPIDDHARDNALRNMATTIARHHITQIFIETPYRNNRLMEKIIAVLPENIKLCVASDITGANQSIITRRIREWKKIKYNYDKIPTIFVLGE